MQKKIDEILELAKFHGFSVEYQYPDGKSGTEMAVTIEELGRILSVVLRNSIDLPVGIGDTIYEKKSKVVNCRYFGDEYAAPDGQPHCLQHEYDCGSPEDGGQPCDAELEYFVEPIVVDDLWLSMFADAVIQDKMNKLLEEYALNKEDADKWVSEKTAKFAEERLRYGI